MCIRDRCINEGMAASMGSVLWAAGERSLMRDYAILMIHNPFLLSAEDERANDMVTAFTPVSYTHLDVYKRQIFI